LIRWRQGGGISPLYLIQEKGFMDIQLNALLALQVISGWNFQLKMVILKQKD